MSQPSEQNASTHSSRETPEQTRDQLLDDLTPESVLSPVRTVSFWMAVSMPFLYLPLLVGGLETPDEVVAFLALVILHVAALVVGHSHYN
ncbi:hypothetical protein [Halovenus salina]|uniref:Uncharacterized protein n=1 Tax=Halovenus salina TaxID=1510225 RepID=A0ABD5W366_9EURY|nr:hypothetical protein [Halovenus salina]